MLCGFKVGREQIDCFMLFCFNIDLFNCGHYFIHVANMTSLLTYVNGMRLDSVLTVLSGLSSMTGDGKYIMPLIAGRTIQGIGGGVSEVLSGTIRIDMTTL